MYRLIDYFRGCRPPEGFGWC